MQSIRRKLTLILVVCTVVAVLLSTFFVNLAVDNTFNKYLADNQEKRNARIIDYLQETYKKDKRWTENSGKELQHEGYMNNYCLMLLDENKNEIWGMNPEDIKSMNLSNTTGVNSSGEYKADTFEIKYENKIVGYVSIGQYQPILLSEQDINFKKSINENIAISVLITLVISIIVSILFSKQFSNPIKKVSETSVDLSNGNYEARSNTKSNVFEINNLIKSINILGERLKYQDDLRKRLVSDISHEIRTPLNILQNNLEAMIDGVFPATTDRLNNLNDEVIRFGKLLNNLSLLKNFEEEKTELNLETLFLDEILTTVLQDFLMPAKEKKIDLILNIEPNEKYAILGDKDQLKQVFINILSNAVKFTNAGGKIIVHLKYDKDHLFVSIKDTGMGIKKNDLPFIFERLYRGDKSRHEIEGSGIGLTIVKKILILHSATIDAESEEGVGTCFTLSFNKEK